MIEFTLNDVFLPRFKFQRGKILIKFHIQFSGNKSYKSLHQSDCKHYKKFSEIEVECIFTHIS